jgi:XTP/dITP diphosphohydrolase
MTGRIVLLVTSPRLPVGLLTAAAWDLVRTNPVFTAADGDQSAALRRAGARVTVLAPEVEELLAAVAAHGTVVWLAGPAGDEPLARALGLRLAREPGIADMELLYGSWDPVGARVLDAVAAIDRLASPGGDPWKRQQTHRSLARYMIEEAYETVDAIDADDLDALRDELGDVLLQVVLHARLAQDRPHDAWSIDDVAGGLVDKMIRRNPHVFADAEVDSIDAITEQWEQIKRAERAGRHPMAGIALGQPALSLAAKIQSRAATAGVSLDVPADDGGPAAIGSRLWDLVAQATALGIDAEAELRRVALAHLAAFDGGAGG